MADGRSARLGLIAGAGDLPLRVAAAAASLGRRPLVVAIAGEADPARFSDHQIHVAELGEIGGILAALKAADCREVALAGSIRRPTLSQLRADWQGVKLMPRAMLAATRGDGALLTLLVEFLGEQGFRVVGVESLLAELLAPAGPLGRLRPSAQDFADLALAAKAAAIVGGLDAGQGAVVRQGRLLALEAAEGTDRMLARCREIDPQGRGGVLVKLPKPAQDRRIDLPTVGPRTVANAAAAGLAGIGIEAGGALLLDRAALLAAADAAGLFVYGFAADEFSR